MPHPHRVLCRILAAVLPATAAVVPAAPSVASAAAGACTVTATVRSGQVSADVQCVEARLAELGFLAAKAVDTRFRGDTKLAVQRYQRMRGLKATGVVDEVTATHLQVWPGSVLTPPPAGTGCAPTGRSGVVDPAWQRSWLCQDGVMVAGPFGTTTASPKYYTANQGPGTYTVWGKQPGVHYRHSDGRVVYMKWMVQYDRSLIKSSLGWHSVPTTQYRGSTYVQPLASVGDLSMRNASGGCLRVLPEVAKEIYDFLQIGDTVVVLSL